MHDVPQTERLEDNPLSRLSTAMVGLYKDQFGRGPQHTRSNWAGPDTLVCQLWSTLTPAERTLAAMGEHQRLRETRLMFQHAAEGTMRESVEHIFGRRVRAFISGMDTGQDVAVEVFILDPADGPAR